MLKNIENQTDYNEYKQRVNSFFERENLAFFSPKVDSEPFFSHSNCECCSRPLGGDRHIMIGETMGDTDIQFRFEYEVCTDCLYFNEYDHVRP